MTTGTVRDHARREAVADAVRRREADIVDLWLRLGPHGPTFGSAEAGLEPEARARYLLPLCRVLSGALRGSGDHLAVYLDERLRYVPAGSADEQRNAVAAALDVELPRLAELTGGPDAEAVLDELRDLHRPLLEPGPATVRVLFVGDCLFVETRAFLTALLQGGSTTPETRQLFFSTNQQVGSIDSELVREIRRFAPEVIGISLFTFEGVPPYTNAWRQAAVPVVGRRALDVVPGLVELLRSLIADVRTVTDATIVVHAPGGLPLDPIRRRLPSWLPAHSRTQRRLLMALREAIGDLVDGTENTLLLDETDLLRERSLRETDGPVFAPTDVPSGYFHTTRLGPILAHEYARVLRSHTVVGRAKAVLVDFDNTLWKGVMADGPVTQNRAAQQALLRLKEAGILLVAVSKNDAANIRWDEMLLRESDFVTTKINWRPKPDNVAAAIDELQLGADAFVLLDDNPVERALVSEQVPGVRALDPDDPETWRTFELWHEFPSTRQTEESRRRTEMYREAAERRASLTQQHDYPSMMRGLKLTCSTRPATLQDMERVLELVQRTNQFNTTTVRRSAEEVLQLVGDPAFGVHVTTLKDRFGDLGVVGLVLFDRGERLFDSVIMSCRAMGFGLERAMLRLVMDAEGPGDFVGRYVRTDRNSPCAGLFESAGFTAVDDELWRLDGRDVQPEVPDWFSVTG